MAAAFSWYPGQLVAGGGPPKKMHRLVVRSKLHVAQMGLPRLYSRDRKSFLG